MAGDDGKITLNNNTIVNNKPKGQGGGIATIYNASITGVNNIIFFNESSQCAGGSIDLTYTACSDNLSGTGNITDDPQFVNAASDDYHLKQGSPCIDTGDPNSPQDPDKTQADMGALFYNQGTGINPVNPFAVSIGFAVYPAGLHVANQPITICYELSKVVEVKLIINDVSGRKVRVLVDNTTERGSHQVVWDGLNDLSSRVSPGVYFCLFSAGSHQSALRLLMVK